MRRSFIVLIFFLGFKIVSAQINVGGIPLSFNKKYNLKSEHKIPEIYILPNLNNQKLKLEAEKNDTKDLPWQFGKNITVNINLKKNSLIDSLADGILYRLKIISKNALTINLKFSDFKIPDKSVLYIYNSDKTDIIGGFTSENNQKSKTFATSLIRGDEIIIEYYEPYDVDFFGNIIIGRVTHGFRGAGEINKGFGNSGDCNMNVACDDGTYGNEIRSVCMLLTGGSGFCSAALVNNTQEDGTPYILTANHCYENPDDLVFMFNWQSSTCDNPSVSPSHDDLSGAVLRAKDYESDFCLFEMNDTPPYTYNVYYAGWNNANIPSTSSVCVHHPNADIKKISYDDNPAVSDYYLGNSSNEQSHWKVIWDRNTTTEPGSSGSPLFNQNGKITGQLHGGFASCNNINEPDWFGKLSYSWNTGTTPETRLKDWLDPLNLGISDFEGYDPNLPLADNDAQVLKINTPEDFYYGEKSFIPSLKIRNRGNNTLTSLKISYQIDNSQIVTRNMSENLTTGQIADISFGITELAYGKHKIKFWTSMPNGVIDEYLYNDTTEKTFFIYEIIFEDDFENGNLWNLSGEFQIGKPEGLGGENGTSDPVSAFSGNNILGTDLSGIGNYPGDYEDNIGYEREYAVSPVIDCRNYENVIVFFRRRLGVDKHKYDQVSFDIKNDTSDWQTVWQNYNAVISDTSWTKQNIDISEFADKEKIMLRFSLGPTNHTDRYCGWNIDDFTVAGNEIENSEISESNIFIYPNPADNYFYIEFLNEEKINFADIIISDLTGKIIYKNIFSENQLKYFGTSTNKRQLIKIDLPYKASGMCVVKIKTDKKDFSEKLFILPKKK